MTEKSVFSKDIYMNDCYSLIHDSIGTGPWIPLYLNQKLSDSSDELFLYSALVPNTLLKDVLSQYTWEIAIDSFHPGFVTYFDNGERKADYLRFGREDNIEPILIQRDFWGIKKTFFDVSEEFRHIYNLYYDESERRYISILDDGNEIEVIKVSDDLIEIYAKYLKEYLAIKNSSLILFINIDRLTNGKFSELGQEYIQEIRQNDTTVCSISISDYDWVSDGDIIYSRLLGKKAILCQNEFNPYDFSPNKGKWDTYVEFIIGIDSNGDEILFSCEEERLANFFGKNRDSPNYVTPIYFKREVLEKYYANSNKYSVHDGNLLCEGLWSLRIDNNHKNFIIVMLGDLGHLPYSEQLYWKSYNVKPEGGFSDVGFNRAFASEFTDPIMKDLLFKQKYSIFQNKWEKGFGWYFFLPLHEEDIHFFKKIRIPLSENQHEFDELVLAITKIIIDSLNEAKISEYLTSKVENERGISKLNRLFSEKDIEGYEGHIQFLRDLQKLKSTATSHRKGEEYQKIKQKWGIGRRRFKDIFTEILERSIQLLEFLDEIRLSSGFNFDD